MSFVYPDGWPRCVSCGRPALTDHLTCGDVRCNEGAARNLRQEHYETEQRARDEGLTE